MSNIWNGIKTGFAWAWEYVTVAFTDLYTNTAFSTKVVLLVAAASLYVL
jgi:hypothetical protein